MTTTIPREEANLGNGGEEQLADESRTMKPFSLDHVGEDDDEMEGSSFHQEGSFIVHFVCSNGPPQIVIICLIVALAMGSTIGVVPAVMTDRYARLNHGFVGDDCSEFEKDEKPLACRDGSADAQNAVAIESFVSHFLTFATSSLVGSISDERGRKGLLVLGIFLSILAPFCLVLMQLIDSMSPIWFYVAKGTAGLVKWIAVALSALSDVMPPKWRAPSFGLLLAGFMCGFAFSPFLALAFGHFGVCILALSLLLGGFGFVVLFLPETLPREVSEEAVRARKAHTNETYLGCLVRNLVRPARELSILNRSKLFRLLSALAFFSGMSSAADEILLLYYVEGTLDFNDQDVAVMFGIIGVLGILVQAVILKPLNDRIGERWVVVVAFAFGTVTNVLYGLAKSKRTIFIAVVCASFTGMAFPTISAIKANNVEEREQGRIQGALFSVSSLASAVGPVSLRIVFSKTKDNAYPGPGTMFLFAAALYVVAIFCACALPKDQANSCKKVSDPMYDRLEPIAKDKVLT